VGVEEGEAVGEGLRDARSVLLVEEDTVEVRWVVRVALPVAKPERAEEGVEDSVAPEALLSELQLEAGTASTVRSFESATLIA
jgi:hypothetical protein